MKRTSLFQIKSSCQRGVALSRLLLASVFFFCFCCSLWAQTLVTFDYTGAVQNWTVPNNVYLVSFTVFGAQGGTGDDNTQGGRGAIALGDLDVTPGQILRIYVGGQGGTVNNNTPAGGGWNGGGHATGSVNEPHGGGGGASDVRVGGNSLNNRVIVAGGGGGSCSSNFVGGRGGGLYAYGGVGNLSGNGGGTTYGGLGGNPDLMSGSFGMGGSSDVNDDTPGGGGGWYGGGAGCAAGGGSGYIGGVTNASFSVGTREGDGLVEIRYEETGPPNDDCPNPIPIECGESITGTTVGANPDFPPCYGNATPSGGLWYNFIGQGEQVTVSTCNPGTDFDTKIGIFTGDCDEPICVISNNNQFGCDDKSMVSFFAATGGNYRILVDGANGAEGNFELTVNCDNVFCENAELLECGQTIEGTTVNTPVNIAPQCGSIPNGRGKWFTFPGNGLCNILTTCYNTNPTTDFDTQISVYKGDCNNLTCVDYNDDGEGNAILCGATPGASTVDFFAEGGETYYVYLHGKGTETGNFGIRRQCRYRDELSISCPNVAAVECFEDIIPVAQTVEEFLAQGGTIMGGACNNDPANYTISHTEETTNLCGGGTITRTYTITSLLTDEIEQCVQLLNFENLGLRVSCPPVTYVECFDEVQPDLENVNVQSDCGVDYSLTGTLIFLNDNSPGCNGEYWITYIFTNECGQTADCTQLFVVENDGPQITVAPDVTVNCPDGILVSPADITIVNPCQSTNTTEINVSGPIINNTDDIACTGTTYTYFYEFEICGVTYEYDRVFTIENTPLQMICAAPQTVTCAEDISPDSLDVQIITDCDLDVLLFIDDPVLLSGAPNCSGSTYGVTFTAVNDCDETVTCTQIYTIQNDPVQLVKVDPYLNDIQNGEVVQIQCFGVDPNWSVPQFDTSAFTAVTSCGLDGELQYQLIDQGAVDCNTTGYLHRYEHIWTIVDACGNTDAFSFVLELVDNIAPNLVGVPADVIIECNEPMPELPTVMAVDECDCAYLTFEENELPNLVCSGNKTIVRTWTATDHCGNVTQASQTITLKDETAPMITLSVPGVNISNGETLQVSCNPEEFPNWVNGLNENSILATDGCASNLTIDFHLDHQYNFSCTNYLERYQPSWTVTDDCGNSAYYSFVVDILDNDAPTIYHDEVAFICNPGDTPNAAAVDGCGQAELQYYDEPMAGCQAGIFMRHYTATDPCGNVASSEQMIVDLMAQPQLIALNASINMENIVYDCQAGGSYSDFNEYSVTPLIDCLPGLELEIQFSERFMPNSCVSGGAKLQLIWTATTACGYVDTLLAEVDVVDNAPPYFPDFENYLEVACGDGMPAVHAIDDCGEVSLDISEIVTATTACPNEREVQRTITATDACGQSTTVTQIVKFVDNEGPVFDLPTSVCVGEAATAIQAYDKCSGQYVDATLLSEDNIASCSAYTMVEMVWEAVDACGNATLFTQTVFDNNYMLTYEVLDDNLKTLISNNVSSISQSDMTTMAILDQLNDYAVIAYDPCGDVVVAHLSKNVQNYADCVDGLTATIDLTWTFVEVCGQTFTYNLQYDIINDSAPVVDLEEQLTLYCTTEIPALDLVEVIGVSYDVEMSDLRDARGDGLVLRKITATDGCGNSTTVTQSMQFNNTSDLAGTINGDFNPACNSSGNIYQVIVTGGTAPYTINWEVNGGNCFIEFFSGNTAEIFVGYGQATIMAEIMDANGCMTYTEAKIVCYGLGAHMGNGTDEHNQQSNRANEQLKTPTATVYPNPFSDVFTLQLDDTTAGTYQIRVMNNLGQVVLQESLNTDDSTSLSLQLPSVPAGMYQLVIQGPELQQVLPIVKVTK